MRALSFGCFLLSAVFVQAEENFRLKAPAGWGGETIMLPPGFAADMKLKGKEHIRFAPGMMKAGSDSFFCYAFAFELPASQPLGDKVLKAEFLKYYRGLSRAVLNGKEPELEFDKFTMELKTLPETDDETGNQKQHVGTLTWVEPFATKKKQTLNVEIQTWKTAEHSYIFACVSPLKRDTKIWKQLHEIRDGYLKSLSQK